MHIGLMRHFPVLLDFPRGWRTTSELEDWYQRYDHAPTREIDPDLGEIRWSRCWSSDLPRAKATASRVFQGRIEFTPLLREARFAQFQTGSLRLPVWFWKGLLRVAWMTGHTSQRVCRDDLLGRVRQAADLILQTRDDILIVSHAGTMAYLSRELRRRGFNGPRFGVAHHARSYIFRDTGSSD